MSAACGIAPSKPLIPASSVRTAGFVSPLNRNSQAEFVCQHCGWVCYADVNAAQNSAERFSNDELNQLPFRDVKAVLLKHLARRLSPDSASAGLDT